MGLSDDQRAMLRLLAQREQGYEDIAALMGLSVDDVRAKVRDALAQLEEEGKEAPPVPEEPLPLSPPTALEPEIQVAVEPPSPAAPPPPPQPKKPSAPRDNGMLIAIGGGIAGLVVIVELAVLLISNSGGDDSGDTTSASTGDSSSQEVTTGDGKVEPTLANLKPVDGSNASGTGLFANLDETLVLAVEAKGLEPTAKGTRYTIWIAASPEKMLPIASTAVGAKGTIEASVKLPAELLLYLANETYKEIAITLTNTARLAAEGNKTKAPTYTGDAVLRGTITGPLVGADELLKKAEEEAAAE
jgi:hypothetical protein